MGARVRRRKNVQAFTSQAAHVAARAIKPRTNLSIKELYRLSDMFVEALEADGWVLLRPLANASTVRDTGGASGDERVSTSSPVREEVPRPARPPGPAQRGPRPRVV